MIEVKKIAIPFAQSGNKSIIYDNRQSGQAENEATWSTGFPPITMIRKEDGGLPPTGLDFNGIFYDISSNVVFSCMGGQYKFGKDYAEKIGGYPKGAILLNNQENKQYISNIDNNKVDFNTADPAKLTQWSVISIADIDKVIDSKISNADFSQALNQKANTSTNINAGNGLTGGGNLTTSRTIDLGTPTAITQSSTNSVTATSHTHSISKATTSQQGIVQLTSTLSDREDLSATPKMVNDVNRDVVTAQKTANTANDKANTAQTRADSAYSIANSKWPPQETVGNGKIMREGAGGLLGSYVVVNDKSDFNKTSGNASYFAAAASSRQTIFPSTSGGIVINDNSSGYASFLAINFVKNETYVYHEHTNSIATLYSNLNTSSDKSGFLKKWGTANALVESDVTNELGNSKSLVASQLLVSNINSSIFAKDQALIDVTSSRSADTIYTNNTNKTIWIQVSVGGSHIGATLYSDEVNCGRASGGQTNACVSCFVRPGKSYKVIGEFTTWVELR